MMVCISWEPLLENCESAKRPRGDVGILCPLCIMIPLAMHVLICHIGLVRSWLLANHDPPCAYTHFVTL